LCWIAAKLRGRQVLFGFGKAEGGQANNRKDKVAEPYAGLPKSIAKWKCKWMKIESTWSVEWTLIAGVGCCCKVVDAAAVALKLNLDEESQYRDSISEDPNIGTEIDTEDAVDGRVIAPGWEDWSGYGKWKNSRQERKR
jgi:hypothetical protein